MTTDLTRRYPLPGHPGLSVRFTYYPAGSDGDGVDVRVIRDADGAVMSMEHPDALALTATLASEEWQAQYHAFLADIRRAGLGALAPDESSRAHLN